MRIKKCISFAFFFILCRTSLFKTCYDKHFVFSTICLSNQSCRLTSDRPFLIQYLKTSLLSHCFYFHNNIFSDLKTMYVYKLFLLVILASALDSCRAYDVNRAKFRNSCESGHDEWKCCVTSPSIKNYTMTVCADIQFLRKDMGFRAQVIFNNYTIFDEEVSVKNPPPICEEIPYLEKVAGACLRFYNVTIDYKNKDLSGCVRFYIDIVGYKLITVPIGCFDFPLSSYDIKLYEKKPDITTKPDKDNPNLNKEVKLIV